MSAPVILHSYDTRWPVLFEEERAALERAGDGLFKAIHHVGSTAIPGMAAKPILDILVLLDHHDSGLRSIEAMRALGYEYRGANGIAGRHYFNKGTPHTHHVHMLAADNPEVGRLLRFRDYLRANPDEARAYECLKRELAARFVTDRRSYSEAKDEFIARIDRLSSSL